MERKPKSARAASGDGAPAQGERGEGEAGPASLPDVRRYLEQAPAASAVVSGAAHVLVFANAAFRQLSEKGEVMAESGVAIASALPPTARAGLGALLDRVRRDGIAAHDTRVGVPPGEAARRYRAAWCCDVWPVVEEAGRLDYLVVTIRAARRGGMRARQRAITERLLLTALREQDLSRLANGSRARAEYLADVSRRLAVSFELETVYGAVARVALPSAGSWSVVDVVQVDGSWRRLGIVHPDPAMAGVVRGMDASITDDVMTLAARGGDSQRLTRSIALGPLLVVPLIAHGKFHGAITFVSPRGSAAYSGEDVQLAEDLAERCANVLDGAFRYDAARLAQADADAARLAAETARRNADDANMAKSVFLTSMSHELRTPLNAILGYSELLMMGLRGPIMETQNDALARIRRAGTHLLGLINDVLNFAKLNAAQVAYRLSDVLVVEVLDNASSMIEPQAASKGLAFERSPCSPTLVARADPEKMLQIVLNLLSNALKFTDAGGRVTLAATQLDRRQSAGEVAPESGSPVRVTVTDTGRGIASDQLASIFDPFVQVGRRLLGAEAGIGLGLAISRDLARGMGGELTVESVVGVGSTFTLTVPSAVVAAR
jgi:signal transduction histidine kinase